MHSLIHNINSFKSVPQLVRDQISFEVKAEETAQIEKNSIVPQDFLLHKGPRLSRGTTKDRHSSIRIHCTEPKPFCLWENTRNELVYFSGGGVGGQSTNVSI